MRKAIRKFHYERWKFASQDLLPQQLAPVRAYVRLHNCFSLGPKFIYKQIHGANVNIEELVKELEVASKELERFARMRESEFCECLVTAIVSRSNSENIDNTFFDDASEATYERMILPLLTAPIDDR